MSDSFCWVSRRWAAAIMNPLLCSCCCCWAPLIYFLSLLYSTPRAVAAAAAAAAAARVQFIAARRVARRSFRRPALSHSGACRRLSTLKRGSLCLYGSIETIYRRRSLKKKKNNRLSCFNSRLFLLLLRNTRSSNVRKFPPLD